MAGVGFCGNITCIRPKVPMPVTLVPAFFGPGVVWGGGPLCEACIMMYAPKPFVLPHPVPVPVQVPVPLQQPAPSEGESKTPTQIVIKNHVVGPKTTTQVQGATISDSGNSKVKISEPGMVCRNCAFASDMLLSFANESDGGELDDAISKVEKQHILLKLQKELKALKNGKK
jgi:hypothetical protein